MRITIAAPYFTPERGSFELYLAKGLVQLGHEVDIVTTTAHFEPDAPPYAAGYSRADGFGVLRLPVLFSMHLAPVPRLNNRQIAALRPDAVISVEYFQPLAIAMARWCARAGVPHYFYQHAYCPPDGLIGAAYETWNRFFKRYVWQRSAGAFALSTAAASYLRSLGYEGKITTATGAVNTARFTPDGPSTLSELAGGGHILLSVARLIPGKNLPFVIELARQIRRDDVRFVILGAGPQEALLRRLSRGVSNLQLISQRVPHDDLPGIYRGATLYLAPSLVEPLNFTVGEALACGVPVIASRIGGLPDLLAAGGGRLLPPDDLRAWTQEIETLLDRPEYLSELRTEAIAASRRLDWREMAQTVDRVLRDAA
jgi:glycosyltransferase involved in cell wall biosynthesis